MKNVTIRIDYEKHPQDDKIWFSKQPIKVKKKKVIVIINWNEYTFEILDKNTGLSVFSGEKTGTNYVALLRRVRKTLIDMGAKVKKKEYVRKKDTLGNN